MDTTTKLDAFCRMAEANQAGVRTRLLDPDWAFTLTSADMCALAAEIRELQRKAAAADAPGGAAPLGRAGG